MPSQKQKIIKTYKDKKTVDVFDKERNKYAFQRYKHKIESDFLKKSIFKIKNEKIKILDVGCGTGRMLPETFDRGKEIEYHGIDTSKAMFKVLKEKVKKINKEKHIKIYLKDASKMPFKNEMFDIVFTYHLLWHLPKKEQEKIIKEMFRVCKKEGFVVFDILNKNFIWGKLKGILKKEKTAGLYKISLKEAKEMADNPTEIEIGKLNDASIKKDSIYKIFNLINKINRISPSSFYHMIYLRIKK